MHGVPRDAISNDEYVSRLQVLKNRLVEDGFDAALVWGRGGGAVDRCADLQYLTGFYPVFPTIRDVPKVWSDRGFAAALITPAETLLFTDEDEAVSLGLITDQSIDRVGVSDRTLVSDILDALEARANIKRLVNIAGDAMTGSQAHNLLMSPVLKNRTIEWNDQFLEVQRKYKSATEIALMREAARIAGEALVSSFSLIKPGVSEASIVAEMARVIAENGGVMANAFVYTTDKRGQAEDNRLPIHSERVFQEGDLFTVDLSGVYGGYFFDLARSYVVGGKPNVDQERAYEIAKRAVDLTVAELRVGNTVAQASQVGWKFLKDQGIDPDHAEFPARGHGLGLAFEQPWIHNQNNEQLEANMVISIEQFVTVGAASATYERNILITEEGPEDLHVVPDFWMSV